MKSRKLMTVFLAVELLITATIVYAQPAPTGTGPSGHEGRKDGVQPSAACCRLSDCMQPPANTVLWLPFDEDFGLVAMNATGGSYGLHRNGPTPTASGAVDYALMFDGVDDYVDVPVYRAIRLGASDDFSVDAWVQRSPGDNGTRTIIDTRFQYGAILRGYSLFLWNGELGFQLADESGWTNYVAPNQAGLVPPTGWHHVTVTVERTSQTVMRFYIDGQPVTGGVFTNNDHPGSLAAVRFRVGARTEQTPGTGCFRGGIDEVEVASRVLRPDEINSLWWYGVNKKGKCKEVCAVPKYSRFISGESQIPVTAQFINLSPTIKQFDYWFQMVPGGPTGGNCGDIDGPTSFPLPWNPLTPFQAFSRVTTDIRYNVGRPIDMNVYGEVGCYEMCVQELGSTDTRCCRGSVIDGYKRVIDFRSSNITTDVGTVVEVGPVMVKNTDEEVDILAYQFVVLDDSMNTDTQAVSLNGLGPGTPVTGGFVLPPGDSIEIELTAEFLEYNPLHVYTVVMMSDSDGVLQPMASMSMMNVIQCCEGQRGNVDGDPNDECNVADLTYLVEYLFQGGPAPACQGEGNVNGDRKEDVNVADLTYLVAYLFQGGDPPPDCGETQKIGTGKIYGGMTLSTTYTNGQTIISLASEADVRGVQMDLSGAAAGEPVKLADEDLEFFYHRSGETIRLGIVDLEGATLIERDTRALVRLPGRYEITDALVSDFNHTAVVPVISAAQKEANVPQEHALHQNYPNPFNPTTEINFSLPTAGDVTLQVYNLLGQRVKSLVSGFHEAGTHAVTWDGTNEAGQPVSSGVYFYRLEADGFEKTKKMMMLK